MKNIILSSILLKNQSESLYNKITQSNIIVGSDTEKEDLQACKELYNFLSKWLGSNVQLP